MKEPQLSLEMRIFIRFATWAASLPPNTVHYLIVAAIFLNVVQLVMALMRSYAQAKGLGP